MNTFDRALELLDESGWTQSPTAEQSDEYPAKLCIGTAMGRAGCVTEDVELLERVIAERYPDRFVKIASFAYFNDHDDTSEDDVRLVLKLASAQVGE